MSCSNAVFTSENKLDKLKLAFTENKDLDNYENAKFPSIETYGLICRHRNSYPFICECKCKSLHVVAFYSNKDEDNICKLTYDICSGFDCHIGCSA